MLVLIDDNWARESPPMSHDQGWRWSLPQDQQLTPLPEALMAHCAGTRDLEKQYTFNMIEECYLVGINISVLLAEFFMYILIYCKAMSKLFCMASLPVYPLYQSTHLDPILSLWHRHPNSQTP